MKIDHGEFWLYLDSTVIPEELLTERLEYAMKECDIACPYITRGTDAFHLPMYKNEGINPLCYMVRKNEDDAIEKLSLKRIKYVGVIHDYGVRQEQRIPKIIHQMWIGKNPNPFVKEMQDWKDKNPSYEYHLWTDDNIPKLRNQKQYDEIKQWCGKGDILRYELLYDMGGIYIDSDTVCINPLDDFLLENESFVCWESEVARPGLMASTYIGTIKGSPLAKRMIDEIGDISDVNSLPAWQSVGPLLLSKCARDYNIKIYPSGMLIPNHYTGAKNNYKGKVYADHLWHSTYNGL